MSMFIALVGLSDPRVAAVDSDGYFQVVLHELAISVLLLLSTTTATKTSPMP